MVIEGIGWGGEGVRSGFAAARRWLAGLLLLPAVALAADPQVAGFIDDDPVVAGATYRYTVTVVNNDIDAATNTQLRVSVPAGASFVSASPASQNCLPTTPTQIDCNLGTVGANGADVRSIVLTWRALGPGPATIAASATLTASNDANSSNNTLTQNTTVSEGGDLSLAIAAAPSPVVGGGNVTYTLTARNDGPNVSGNLVLTHNLSPSVSFVSASGSGWTCSHASGVVTCRRSGSHAVGATVAAVTIVGTVTASGGTVTSTATVAPDTAGGTADPELSNNTASASTVVTPGADVRIAAMSVTSANPASAGSDVTFQIQPRNAGPATAVNAVVTHTLPAGWSFVSASGPSWTCSAAGQVVTCTRASLSTSATDNITLVATAPASVVTRTSYSHSAAIASATADAVSSNNSGAASVDVLPDGADLRLTKSKTPNPVALGSDMSSSIVVTNLGPRTATGALRVVDRLSGESFVSASGSGWSCALSGQDVVCNHANSGGLAVNAALPTLSIVTNATVAGTLGNVACTSGSVPTGSSATPLLPAEGDADASNNCASASATSTTVRPDLAITKTASTPSGDKIVSTSESSATFTLLVSNVSATAQGATGVVITDTLPSGLFISGRTTITTPVATVSGGSTAVFGCAVSGGTVTCTQSGGVLSQGQSVSVPITVNRPFGDSASAPGGVFTNTATVTNTAEGDPVAANNSASDSFSVAPIADVEMTGKNALPTAVRAGENSTYTISFRNNGPSTANGVVVTDTFGFPGGDSGLTVVSIASSRSGSTCSIAAGAVLNPASPSFTCNIGTLANGQAESITLVVRPNFLAPNVTRSFGNTAQITTSSVENPAGGDNGNNSKAFTLGVNPAAIDLLVNTSDVPDLAIVGAGTGDPVPYTLGATFINYRVRVSSVGPSYGTSVRVTESMTPPANRQIRFVCDTTTAGGSTCNPTPLCSVANVLSGLGTAIPAFTCDVPAGTATTGAARGELASGQSKDIFLRFEVMNQPAPTGDVFNIQSTVSANEPDTQASNDQEAETTTTRQRIDLRVTKSASLPTVQLRQPFNWVINVVNNGPGDSLQTDLTDTLPVGSETTGTVSWTRTGTTPGTGSCTVSGRVVSCALGQLDNLGTATITVPVRFTSLPSGGSASNSATVDTDPAKTGSMDVPGGNNTGTASIVVQQSSLAGTVFQDRDRSGSNGGVPQAAGSEPRIAGVTLTLSGTDAYGNAVSQTTTTDASGNYLFSGLSPSDASGYTVTQTQPAGYVNGPVAPPSSGALAPTAGGSYGAGAGSSGNSSYSAIVLPANTAATQYHFPEVRQPSLSGFVYLDLNSNATRDAGTDTAIAGATVRLLNASSGALVASTTTDASGAYAFTNLDPLVAYTLEQPLPASPANLQRSGVNPGLVNGLACASGCTAQPDAPSSGTDRIAAIDLSAGADGTLFNFGERVVPFTSISGLVYLDANRDHALGSGETVRIPGVVIRLVQGADCATGSTLQTVTTAADGAWRFDNVTPGQAYLVCQTQPVGYGNGNANGVADSNQISIPSLAAGGSSGNSFGETLSTTAAISGKVWLDANNDGSSGTGAAAERGIAGVALVLTGTDSGGVAVNRSTTTDADGNYRFDGLASGSYSVTEPGQPADTLDGQVLAGSTGGTATAKGSTPSAISAIALAAGQQSTANDFGEVPVARIAGRVWADNNDNGRIDAGETGLAGVALVLTGTDDLGRTVSVSLSTGADGSYAFEGLRPGTYTVTEPSQPAGTVDGRSVAGSLGGTASAAGTATTTPSAIAGIVLPAGGASLANNFGEIGQSPDLRVTESHTPAILTVGQTATYTISVGNVGELPSSGAYAVEDQLPPGLTLAATPTGNGWTCSGAIGASRFSCTSSAVIAAGATSAATITVVASVGAAAVPASPVNNAVMVDGGGELDARRPTTAERSALTGDVSGLPLCAATPQANACRDPAPVQLPASLSGTVWLDLGAAPKLLDGGDRRLPGWGVEVVDGGGQIVRRATTGSDGSYQVTDLVPGTEYAVRFRDPVSGVVFGPPVNGETAPGSSGASCAAGTPPAGTASSCVSSIAAGGNPQLNVVLAAGQELPQQSLPVDPSGVVYDSGTRAPVAGAVVTLAPTGSCAGWNPGTQIVGATLGGYTVSGNAIAMTVGDNGAYQFLIGPSAPASCTFGLTVTPPAGYTSPSQVLPPASGALTPTGGTGSTYAVLPSAAPPTGSDTTYYLAINTGSAGPNVVHNHIPLDPALPSGMSLSKTGDKAQAEVGDSVRYTITVQVAAGPRPRQTTVVDRLPAGFTYIRGTATVNDVAIADPVGGVGPTLAFNLGSVGASGQAVLKYRVRVGVGAQQGDGVNRARAYGCGLPAGCVDASFAPVATAVATNEGRHAVRVSGGVFATEACVLGKVFVDCNGNHVQDREELGVPGVRLVTSDGTTLISDSEGKYSLCGLAPRSHVIKVDPATLPRGARLTTSSNRNLGDAGSLWLDLKTGELHRADFIEGSCSNTVLEQVKARRAQGEVRAPEVEKKGGPALRFDSKAHGLNAQTSPQQGTDGANQLAPKPRQTAPALQRTETETNVPTPQLPMNRPPPDGRDTSQAPDPSPNSTQPNGGSNGTR